MMPPGPPWVTTTSAVRSSSSTSARDFMAKPVAPRIGRLAPCWTIHSTSSGWAACQLSSQSISRSNRWWSVPTVTTAVSRGRLACSSRERSSLSLRSGSIAMLAHSSGPITVAPG